MLFTCVIASTWETLLNYDYPGNLIDIKRNTTRADCQGKCLRVPECIGFGFRPSTKVCWLKSKFENGQIDNSVNTFALMNSSSGNNFAKEYGFKNLVGKNIGYQDIPFGQCFRQCRPDLSQPIGECKGYVFNLPRGAGCWFKNAVNVTALVDDTTKQLNVVN